MSKDRSRILILSHISQFSLGREIGGYEYCGLKDMRFREARVPEVGSLVAISCASPSKWYLSWVREVIASHSDDGTVYGYTYALESIEDEEICNWSNISLFEYDRSQVASHPEWYWTNEQHSFADKWQKCCYKERDAYLTLPTGPTFGDGYSVTVGTRTRFSLDEHRPSISFSDWRKVTKAQLIEFYDSAVSSREKAA